mgnify:CR=1 FL=1
MTERFSTEEMRRLAARAVHKIDLLGPRGTTLCTMEEIEAMAALLVARGALRPPAQAEGRPPAQAEGRPPAQAPAEEVSAPLSTGDEK